MRLARPACAFRRSMWAGAARGPGLWLSGTTERLCEGARKGAHGLARPLVLAWCRRMGGRRASPVRRRPEWNAHSASAVL